MSLADLNFDPFKTQKLAAFEKSSDSIASMAQAVQNLVTTSGSTSAVDVIREGLYKVIQVRSDMKWIVQNTSGRMYNVTIADVLSGCI
jgi:two-component sensor histidine kinase